MKTLFIGDIVGRKARNFAIEKIKEFKKDKLFDLIIVNVENSAGGFGVGAPHPVQRRSSASGHPARTACRGRPTSCAVEHAR